MLLCTAALLAVIAIIHVTVYMTTKDIIEEEIMQESQGLAVVIAHYIEEDREGYKAFLDSVSAVDVKNSKEGIEPEYYQDSAYYRRMQKFFADVKKHSNIKYIYTERRIDEKNIEFILDAEPVNAADHSPPRSIGENDQWREAAYSTGDSAGFKPVHYSKWGPLLGGYAPIFDEDGKTLLGIIGVNVDSSHLYSHLWVLQLILFAVYAFIICVTLLLLMKYSHTILDPMFKDKLTGAYNKRYFEKLLRAEISLALKERKDLSLLILDLDHFKKINDTYGHPFGDKVLSSVSTTIKNSLRQHDHFIRYGGEEFVAVIPGAGGKRAVEIAERVRTAVEDSNIYNEEQNTPVKMTVSIGVAHLNRPNLSVQEFLESADKALYTAKKTRNSVSSFGLDVK